MLYFVAHQTIFIYVCLFNIIYQIQLICILFALEQSNNRDDCKEWTLASKWVTPMGNKTRGGFIRFQ